MSLFAGVTFTKYNMAPKRRTISKIENCLVQSINQSELVGGVAVPVSVRQAVLF